MGQQPNLFAQEYVDAAQAIRDALTRDITDLLDPAKFSGKPALTPEDPALEALRRNVVDVKIKLTIAHVNADYGEMRRIADDAVRDWCHDERLRGCGQTSAQLHNLVQWLSVISTDAQFLMPREGRQ